MERDLPVELSGFAVTGVRIHVFTRPDRFDRLGRLAIAQPRRFPRNRPLRSSPPPKRPYRSGSSADARFIASIDHRTTADRLWLRFGDDRAELLRPIKWNQVERVEIAGERNIGPGIA